MGTGVSSHTVTIDDAFAEVSRCFPQVAELQGVHFKYATRNGIKLIERKGHDGFFYWLSVGEHFVLIHTSLGSKLAPTGRRFAKIPTIRPDIDGEDICNEFERQVYIDLKDPKQLAPFHPNRRHVPIPISFAELKANRPDLYAKAVSFFQKA